MSFFSRSLKILSNAEQKTKDNLIKELSQNVKEIQFEYQKCDKDYLELNDCTRSLCTTLEAIFLHGLKDSFLLQTVNVIAGDHDRRPNPNFWPLLLIFLHKHTIEQIETLSQINTDVGNCRSWICISLNESLMSSYFNNIRKNTTALNLYYHKYAFLKDIDMIELAGKLIEGIEASIPMNLPINSSLLNQWTNLPLEMSGIWRAPIISSPVVSGFDVASSLTDNIPISTPHAIETKECFPDSIKNTPFIFESSSSVLKSPSPNATVADDDLDDNEHLKLFLEKVDQIHQVETPEILTDIDKNSIEYELSSENIRINSNDDQQKEIPNIGNSIHELNNSWSNEMQENNIISEKQKESADNKNKNLVSRSNSMTTSISSFRSTIERYSYDMLLTKHKNQRSQQEINFQDDDIWQRFEKSLSHQVSIASVSDANKNDQDNDGDLDFEFVTKEMVEKFTINELHEMARYLCKLAREMGLDYQGFVCKSCSHPLGIGFANAQVCAYSGYYYCESCISEDQFIIPAKIIYNLDFRRYTVSKRAAIFLNEFQFQPLIDLKIHNSNIYQASDEMSNLQSLRIQLNFIRVYLYNCCELTIAGFKKQVDSKEYLYEHIHQYSIGDLYMIPRGQLAQLLQKTYQYGEQHILKCNLCSVKGFLCEICGSTKVLYPFHIKTTFRCERCGAVFHDQCLNKSQPCPKCKRRQMREDLPLLEAINML